MDRNAALPFFFAMSSSSSLVPSTAIRHTVRPVWIQEWEAHPGGLALAREKGWSLVWDDKGSLHVVNRAGVPQARTRLAGNTASACAADDGSAFVAVGANGEVWWLAPDLMICWKQVLPHAALAAALDSFGQYLAVADARGHVHCYDRYGRSLSRVQSPRPLHHIVFVPMAPLLLGCADYGLVTCLDLSGRCLWRDGLVAHVGSLTVSGNGDQVVLACFSAGLQRYTSAGADKGRLTLAEPCRLASLSFDGRFLLAAGLANRLFLVDRMGQTLCEQTFNRPIVSLALGALGESAMVALEGGGLVGLELVEERAT
jgi:hypothetical protein